MRRNANNATKEYSTGKKKKETVREENNLIQTTEFPYSECQASGDINGYYVNTS